MTCLQGHRPAKDGKNFTDYSPFKKEAVSFKDSLF
jgi:hypothetical protein